MKEYVETNRALGELGHPDSPTINLPLVSHKFISIKEDGNNFGGRAKILDTPNGKIAKAFIDEGVVLGMSSRGMGSLKSMKEGFQLVQDDYFLATPGDLVADPSAPDALMTGIMEGKEWVFDALNERWETVENYKKTLLRARQSQIEEVSLRIFENLLKKI